MVDPYVSRSRNSIFGGRFDFDLDLSLNAFVHQSQDGISTAALVPRVPVKIEQAHQFTLALIVLDCQSTLPSARATASATA